MGACRRGYRSVFWDVFVRGKCTPGRVEDGRERDGVPGWEIRVIFGDLGE